MVTSLSHIYLSRATEPRAKGVRAMWMTVTLVGRGVPGL
jgi:hypothetical protein